MKKLLKKHETKIRFGTIGGLNTLIDFGMLFVMTNFLLVGAVQANIASVSVAFIFSFFANKKFTFRSSGQQNIVKQMILFTVVTLFGLWVIQGTIIFILLPMFNSLGVNSNYGLLASKLVATIASLVWNYLLYSRVVFKNPSAK